MGSKNKPGNFDCYATAEPDEPMFVLLGRDPLAPLLVELWAGLRAVLVKAEGEPEKIKEARQCAANMRDWPIAKKLPVKVSIEEETFWEIVSAIQQEYMCRDSNLGAVKSSDADVVISVTRNATI